MREEMRRAESQAQEQSPVADSEKPGPEREETDPEEPSQLQTTGGNLADTDGEGEVTFTFVRPNTPPPQVSPPQPLPPRESKRE